MRRVPQHVARITRCAISIVVLAVVPHAWAQGYAVVEQAHISVVQKLAGHMDVQVSREPAPNVRVELCSPDWKTILKSTKTDGDGDFSFDDAPGGKLFFLRLSAPGFDPYQLRVRVNKQAKSKLVIHLVIAT
jgi:hypothetical protein